MNYKVGDKVRVRKDLEADEWYGGVIFVKGMEKFLGNTYTIKIIKDKGKVVRFEHDYCLYNFSLEMLEPIKKKPKYWIAVYNIGTAKKGSYRWMVHCINGRIKSISPTFYQKRSLCLNDAKAFAEETGLEIRL